MVWFPPGAKHCHGATVSGIAPSRVFSTSATHTSSSADAAAFGAHRFMQGYTGVDRAHHRAQLVLFINLSNKFFRTFQANRGGEPDVYAVACWALLHRYKGALPLNRSPRERKPKMAPVNICPRTARLA